MTSLGKGKKTRGKGKNPPKTIKHPNPGISLLFETQSADVIHMQVKEVVAVTGFVWCICTNAKGIMSTTHQTLQKRSHIL